MNRTIAFKAKVYRLRLDRQFMNDAAATLMASAPSFGGSTGGDFDDFGDFVGFDEECEVEGDAEPRREYEKGLYCPRKCH